MKRTGQNTSISVQEKVINYSRFFKLSKSFITDIGADEAPGSEASEPMEEADIIEESLETSVEDSKTSKSE